MPPGRHKPGWSHEWKYLYQNFSQIEKSLHSILLERDIFICHANADKNKYVNILYKNLRSNGISVWYDEGEIIWGDSITEKIEEGIKTSKFALICFSENFLKANWPYSEFVALFHRQQEEKRKLILPLILNSKDEIIKKYPLIKDIYYEEWEKGIDYLINEIKKILSGPTCRST